MSHEQISLLDAGEKAQFAKLQFAENREPRCPVAMIYDCSGSMFMGDTPMMDMLKRGHEELQKELVNDPVASERADMSYITYGTEVTPPTMFATPGEADDDGVLSAIDFKNMGLTYTNTAILTAIDAVEERLSHYGKEVPHYSPMIFLLTDGANSDDNEMHPTGVTMKQAAIQRLASKVAPNGNWLFMPVYISTGDPSIDAQIVESLSGYPMAPAPVPMPLTPGKMLEFFRWISASVQTRSASRTDETVNFPRPDTPGTGFDWAMPSV